jgi:hemolysin activation/secretion protein
MSWLKESRFAFRLGGAVGLPEEGTFFTLGGGDRFRGFDLRERQGSATWVGSVEWRLPLTQNVCWDLCDHVATVRNVYLAPFYDIGDAYVNDQSLGPVAHAFGVGLRVDVTWLSLIERTMLRVDVAKTVNQATPWQVWFGIQHPF